MNSTLIAQNVDFKPTKDFRCFVFTGTANDAFRMASRVGPNGVVVGVDASSRMIEEAIGRTPANVRVSFAQADARNLPCKEESFSRCRIDRTLHEKGKSKPDLDLPVPRSVRAGEPGEHGVARY